MISALSIREEDWWPFPDEVATDLLKFLKDDEGAAPRIELGSVANDNWPLHIESVRVSELPAIMIWSPRYRTAD
jgi:hypothetical protein